MLLRAKVTGFIRIPGDGPKDMARILEQEAGSVFDFTPDRKDAKGKWIIPHWAEIVTGPVKTESDEQPA